MTELEVTLFAGSLLLLRAVSLYFVCYVIWKQLKLWHKVKKSGAKESARLFRVLLFALASAMLFENIVPVGIDIVAIASLGDVTLSFDDLGDAIIVQYFTSNAIFDLIKSVIIWMLYRIAGRYQ